MSKRKLSPAWEHIQQELNRFPNTPSLTLAKKVMKAHASKEDANGADYTIETFGSATPQNCMSKHLVEMAEKRALSRAILKVTNMYEHGVFGEDEDVHRD